MRARHVGIVACSAEGAALCYRTLCAEAGPLMGEHMHPEVSLHTTPLGVYMEPIRRADWGAVAEIMLASARKVAGMGAEFAICPDNTIHQAYDLVAPRSPIPWLHIAECVAQEARERGYRTLAVLGTRYLMGGPVYPEVLSRHGLAWRMPEEGERDIIDRVIFTELVNGVFLESSRKKLNRIVGDLGRRGCDAAVLGCTEIPLLVGPADCPLPLLDSTRLLARAALREALRGTSP